GRRFWSRRSGLPCHHRAPHGRTFALSVSTRFPQQPKRPKQPDPDAAATAAEAATAEEPLADAGPPPDGTAEQIPNDASAEGDPARGGTWRDRHPSTARTLAYATTALSALLVLLALLLPNQLTLLTPSQFARIPVEGILGAALLLVLPPKT